MYGIFTHIWLIYMVNLGKYTIHGWYRIDISQKKTTEPLKEEAVVEVEPLWRHSPEQRGTFSQGLP